MAWGHPGQRSGAPAGPQIPPSLTPQTSAGWPRPAGCHHSMPFASYELYGLELLMDTPGFKTILRPVDFGALPVRHAPCPVLTVSAPGGFENA